MHWESKIEKLLKYYKLSDDSVLDRKESKRNLNNIFFLVEETHYLLKIPKEEEKIRI